MERKVNYRIRDEIVTRTNNDGTVVVMKLDDSNIFFKIDGIAARVWKELITQNSLEEIKADILNDYDIDRDTLDRDIERLLIDLEQKELITKT